MKTIKIIGRFFKSMLRVLKEALFGRPVLVSEHVLNERKRKCVRCDSFRRETRQCLECFCFIDLKAQLTTEKCPRKKWRK